MPCGPGLMWTLNDDKKTLWKKSMCEGSSYQELQYILNFQYNDPRFRSEDGEVVQIQHGYFRGQTKVCGLDVDGYCEVNGIKYIIELNGCYHHQPCPHAGCQFNKNYDPTNEDENGEPYKWFTKEKVLIHSFSIPKIIRHTSFLYS